MSSSSVRNLVVLAACLMPASALAQTAQLWNSASTASNAIGYSSSLIGSVSSSLATPSASASSFVTVVPPPPAKKPPAQQKRVLPFSRLAIATKSGTLGLGGQIATPLASWLTLRAGAQLFTINYGLALDGANYQALIKPRFGQVSLDIFPFHGFHISPGVLYSHSWFSAAMSVPGGSAFSLGSNTFTSGSTDSINGSAAIVFTRNVMPALTIGFGNMITRAGKHWSMPFEVGAAYTGPYSVQLKLQGTACIPSLGCMSTSSSIVQQSVAAEQASLTEAAKHFQLYPIISSGISFRF
jgi:hypothetical protein